MKTLIVILTLIAGHSMSHANCRDSRNVVTVAATYLKQNIGLRAGSIQLPYGQTAQIMRNGLFRDTANIRTFVQQPTAGTNTLVTFIYGNSGAVLSLDQKCQHVESAHWITDGE